MFRMILNLFVRIKSGWYGKLVVGKYYSDSGLLVLPYEDRPRIFWQLKSVLDFLRRHWKFLVTTTIAIAGFLVSSH
jgi:hypothetical protein